MSKHPILLSPEEDAVLKSLYADLAHASRRATVILQDVRHDFGGLCKGHREITRIVGPNKEIRGPARERLDGTLTRCR